ncbi:MAG: phosphoribosylanthranilate isomerase [Eubacteriales bacterium]|nr:phosphoribosylanthranilate isomerase [Eubacteriales bacterium]
MTKIKICGLKSEQDVEYVNACKPDYIGFVFLEGRKRYVSPAQAKRLREQLDSDILAVGVFVDAPVEQVIQLLEDDVIQIAQLHGNETQEYVARIRAHSDKPIIKAFVVRSKEDAARAMEFPCDYLLLDGGLGQGETFDWSLIQDVRRPFFLAGGLDTANVRSAMQATMPYAVDVSSGVETDGKKDFEKIKTFIQTVRQE